MEYWFWISICYSFLGYLLERVFACVTHATKQVRKCFLLLPLCPVYGLAVAIHLALLPEDVTLLRLVVQGAAVTTAVEYAVHLFYDRMIGVRFWDYTGVWGNLNGRVCIPFSAAWGLLSAGAVLWIQPVVERVIFSAMPPELTLAAWMVVTADILLSLRLLRRSGDTELLSWRAMSERFG